jgi:hypothetical protein
MNFKTLIDLVFRFFVKNVTTLKRVRKHFTEKYISVFLSFTKRKFDKNDKIYFSL